MDVKALLSAHPAWLDHLESVGGFEVVLPGGGLADELLRLTVPHEDVNAILAARPEPGTPQWWLTERCAHSLVSTMGAMEDPPPFQPLPELGPYFYVYVFLAALPHTRAHHRSLGIPEEVSWATFTDLGRNMAVHRKRFGTAGLHVPYWFMLHARGILYELGRLQFNLATLGRTTGETLRAAGLPLGPGSPSLAVHVPGFHGPLTPEACDASFERARRFFPRHFPGHFPGSDRRVMTCGSWLLDEQLARYLPADSNILAFQRRFHPLHRFDDGDVLSFVFGGDATADPAALPRRTRLERAIADHLTAGGTWYGRRGWLPF
ncbi:acyltransferase domain-containing protein [Nonomuraea sp. NPDC050643]|uniref:acyltransferase domain-containing protein n=1 Tax=Nonomuraea sp. NPDC050643 TaxID=3155660 RepID=UPI0033EDA056